jgi:hypothetical protein
MCPNFRLTRTAYFAGAAAIAAVLTITPFFPTQDGPVHLYYSVVLADLLKTGATFGSAFAIRHFFPPYAFHWYLLIALNCVFDPLVSERITAALSILWLAAGWWRLSTAVNGREAGVQLLFLPFLSTWALYMGFFNFLLALGMCFYLMGWWLDHHERLRTVDVPVFLFSVVLLASMHPVPLLMFFLFAGILVLLELAPVFAAENRSRSMWAEIRRRWLELLSLGSSALVMLWIDHFVTAQHVAEQIPSASGILRRAGSLASLHEISPLAYSQWTNTVALIGAMLLGVVLAWRRTTNQYRDRRVQAIALMAAACLLIYLVAPGRMNGSFLFEKRFSTVFCMLAITLAAGAKMPARPRLWASGAAVACALLVIVAQRNATIRTVHSLDDVMTAPLLHRGSRVLQIRLGPPPASGLHYDPSNAAASYWCLRSHSVLINMPWMDLDIMPIEAARGVQLADYDDAGALILRAVRRNSPVVPLDPDAIALERSPDRTDEENALILRLTTTYGYRIVRPATDDLTLLVKPGAIEHQQLAQVRSGDR